MLASAPYIGKHFYRGQVLALTYLGHKKASWYLTHIPCY